MLVSGERRASPVICKAHTYGAQPHRETPSYPPAHGRSVRWDQVSHHPTDDVIDDARTGIHIYPVSAYHASDASAT
jgi:hypothetical protein